MQKLTWGLMFCLSTMAVAEEVEIRLTDAKKPVKCGPLSDVFNGIQKIYGESHGIIRMTLDHHKDPLLHCSRIEKQVHGLY